ncbi:MAG: peptidoglycan DD-metalloendopeptidase family protein [Betaproteobacteria bacterium]|nr:MAG: peptidoglycan DD-metalloendopeptidase family protein [Betaproteobacteria bacterium]
MKLGFHDRGALRQVVLVAVFALVLASGCGSTSGSAPVFDRSPAPDVGSAEEPRADDVRGEPIKSKPPAQSAAASTKTAGSSSQKNPAGGPQTRSGRDVSQSQANATPSGDWRPGYHTVRKGDTLYSIALDFGHDYRDLAAWNNLADASYIQIGQRLRLSPPAGQRNTESVALPEATLPGAREKQSATVSVPTFSDPKAFRSAYSEQALSDIRRVLAGEVETAVVLGAPAKPKPAPLPAVSAAPTRSSSLPARPDATAGSSAADEALQWEWPALGTLLYGFAKGPIKKGVGIEGNPGQSVVSSAPGKVVYGGSGLRGYGNLIIVKHNATYLSVYAHNKQLLVSEGQMVAQGQKIAVMGEISAGQTGLHFEIRRLGRPMDPLKYLPDRRS